jgi:hypothetical protein
MLPHSNKFIGETTSIFVLTDFKTHFDGGEDEPYYENKRWGIHHGIEAITILYTEGRRITKVINCLHTGRPTIFVLTDFKTHFDGGEDEPYYDIPDMIRSMIPGQAGLIKNIQTVMRTQPWFKRCLIVK